MKIFEISRKVKGIIDLAGPVYDIGDVKHTFSEIKKNVEGLKELSGPVYDVEHQNRYTDIIKHTEKLEKLFGPVYHNPFHTTFDVLRFCMI